ncbi:ORF12 [callitrichine gammaherpesvirus 3]|uniref:ORF12 n=1 Tax=callitrichine gammaherpesvirus 3 TaxID=106331 RepID=Q993J8_9GAMA|nr:ORF12 [callitrichine gammaherpesvirus 3]AAK38220.1 ORF12 [callitrichine gammaherpesvirus 3]
MDPTRGLNAISQEERSTFAKIPKKRMIAGIRAHTRFYKKLLSFSDFGEVADFIGICNQPPTYTTFKIFIEVTLGRRRADCVIVTFEADICRCFIIELKTCMRHASNPVSVTRRIQRHEGISQLSDCVTFLLEACSTRDIDNKCTVSLHPVLLLKNQRTLKTVHIEFPQFSQLGTAVSVSRLLSLLDRAHDGTLRARLCEQLSNPPPRRSRIQLGTKREKHVACPPRGDPPGGSNEPHGPSGWLESILIRNKSRPPQV